MDNEQTVTDERLHEILHKPVKDLSLGVVEMAAILCELQRRRASDAQDEQAHADTQTLRAELDAARAKLEAVRAAAYQGNCHHCSARIEDGEEVSCADLEDACPETGCGSKWLCANDILALLDAPATPAGCDQVDSSNRQPLPQAYPGISAGGGTIPDVSGLVHDAWVTAQTAANQLKAIENKLLDAPAPAPAVTPDAPAPVLEPLEESAVLAMTQASYDCSYIHTDRTMQDWLRYWAHSLCSRFGAPAPALAGECRFCRGTGRWPGSTDKCDRCGGSGNAPAPVDAPPQFFEIPPIDLTGGQDAADYVGEQREWEDKPAEEPAPGWDEEGLTETLCGIYEGGEAVLYRDEAELIAHALLAAYPSGPPVAALPATVTLVPLDEDAVYQCILGLFIETELNWTGTSRNLTRALCSRFGVPAPTWDRASLAAVVHEAATGPVATIESRIVDGIMAQWPGGVQVAAPEPGVDGDE